MKRTKDKGVIRWRKTGGGSFTATLNGRRKIVKPGEVFSARLEDIPESFRDTIIPVDPNEFKVAEKHFDEVDIAKLEYTVEKAKGVGYYNVLDSEGKQVNEKSLRKDAAEALVSSLK